METQRRSRRTPRRWCLPPAVLRDPAETLEGERVLAESPDDLGLLLWRTVRDVSLWAETPAVRRGGLFSKGSADLRIARLTTTDVPKRIAGPLDTIHSMLTITSRADGGTLAVCCLEVVAWAPPSHSPRPVQYRRSRNELKPLPWLGSLILNKQDATGQIYMRNRYYDPQTGQFTQQDPIGLAGGLNAYGFAAGDPVSYSDPYGLNPCKKFGRALAIAGGGGGGGWSPAGGGNRWSGVLGYGGGNCGLGGRAGTCGSR